MLSFMVWLHHFFTMGAGADVNAFFGVATMIIAVPTGVKIFNWLFTLYGGSIRFTTPVHWALGFMVTFVIGGMTGVLMAIPPADFVLHNSLFLVAHFHNVIIGGVLFGAMAGYTYWFPKAFGFKLHEGLGKAVFWCWFFGFYLAFMPLYVLGLMGATRRMQHYADPTWQPLMVAALGGAVIILIGIVLTIVQLIVSIRTRERRRDLTGDPWNGRTLEWSISSPPPAWNFASLPTVTGPDAFWEIKRHPQPAGDAPRLTALQVPRNSALGFFIAFFSVILGFALIWHIWWLAVVGLLGVLAVSLRHAWRTDLEEELVPVETIAAHERAHLSQSGSGMSTVIDIASEEMPTGIPLSQRGPAPARVVAGFGFWLFLLSDIIIFSALFAAYAVLCGATNGGPTAVDLFDKAPRHVRDRLLAGVEFHLRHDDDRHRETRSVVDLFLGFGHGGVGHGVSVPGGV